MTTLTSKAVAVRLRSRPYHLSTTIMYHTRRPPSATHIPIDGPQHYHVMLSPEPSGTYLSSLTLLHFSEQWLGGLILSPLRCNPELLPCPALESLVQRKLRL